MHQLQPGPNLSSMSRLVPRSTTEFAKFALGKTSMREIESCSKFQRWEGPAGNPEQHNSGKEKQVSPRRPSIICELL